MTFLGPAFIIGISWCAITIAFSAFALAVAKAIRLGIAEIAIFAGPTFVRLEIAGVKVTIRLIPVSVSIDFCKRFNAEGVPSQYGNSIRCVEDLRNSERLLLAFSTPLCFLLIGLFITGASITTHITTALPQIYLGAINPSTKGSELLQQYIETWHASPVAALGIISVKYAVFLLIPTAGSPGFFAVVTFLKMAFNYEMPNDFNLLVAIPLFLPAMIVFGGWTMAVGYFLYALL